MTHRILTIRVPEDLHRRVRVKMAEQDLNFQKLVLSMMTEFVDGPKKKVVADDTDNEFQRQISVAREGLRRYRNALKASA